ncbi:hypothetical protein CEK28_08765 [Xenophilus sp. AP218F]|nr:hypothetical protein CEK28_08765 [Xenophilus sp. AP218F]
MDKQTIDQVKKELQQPLLDSLAQLNTSLKTLSQLQLANEFYTLDERRSLYSAYQALREADLAAYQRLVESGPPDGMSWAQWSEALGETETAKRKEARNQLQLEKQSASDQVSAFEKKHKLLIRLLEAKEALAKGRFD